MRRAETHDLDRWEQLRFTGAEHDDFRRQLQHGSERVFGQRSNGSQWPRTDQTIGRNDETGGQIFVGDAAFRTGSGTEEEIKIRIFQTQHKTNLSAGQHDVPAFLGRAIQNRRVADALHQRCASRRHNVLDHFIACVAIVGSDFHLDQFVLLQCQLQFGEERFRHALVAGLQDWAQVMSLAAEEADLCVGQCGCHAGPKIVGFNALQVNMEAMATRSKSSRRWLDEHVNDPFVKKAKKDGARSRAIYKLEELIDRDKLLKPGMTVVDLGSAPGSWSQLVAQRLDGKGKILAIDILPMAPLAGVEFLQGDFRENDVLAEFESMLNGAEVDLVLSDMAPNKSGVDAVDMPRALYLSELALDFADQHLRVGGNFLIKLFHGVGFDDYVRDMRKRYDKVVIRKPEASRKRSPEVYALAMGKRAVPKP